MLVCAARGRPSSSDQFPDLAIDKASGKNVKRPQLEAMQSFVREGDTVFCHSMDRLARNLDDLRRIVVGLTERGIRIVFVQENLTFIGDDSPMSNLLLSVMGAFAQFERELIRERQREGIAIAKREGKYSGKRISDSFNVQFRAEFFNVLNHANFAAPLDNRNVFTSAGQAVGNAGVIDSTQTPSREIQLAVKAIW
jgi:DNA invertase Pin-like site-specific DNA recombinase